MRESRSYGSVGEPVGNHRLYPEEDGEVLTLTSYPISRDDSVPPLESALGKHWRDPPRPSPQRPRPAAPQGVEQHPGVLGRPGAGFCRVIGRDDDVFGAVGMVAAGESDA